MHDQISIKINHLHDRLQMFTMQIVSETRSKVLSITGQIVEIDTNYDEIEFGYAPKIYVVSCDFGLGMSVGVGTDPEHPERGRVLWFLRLGEDGICYYGNGRKADFLKGGFQKLSV